MLTHLCAPLPPRGQNDVSRSFVGALLAVALYPAVGLEPPEVTPDGVLSGPDALGECALPDHDAHARGSFARLAVALGGLQHGAHNLASGMPAGPAPVGGHPAAPKRRDLLSEPADALHTLAGN